MPKNTFFMVICSQYLLYNECYFYAITLTIFNSSCSIRKFVVDLHTKL